MTTATANKASANKASAKDLKARIMIVTEKLTPKTGDAKTVVVDALGVPSIAPSELIESGATMERLCLNLLAGTTHNSIMEAHDKKGGITAAFPKMSEADKNALRACLDSTPEALREGWASFVASKKRIRGVSLQALRKGIAEPAEPKASLKDALIAWAAENEGVNLPVDLFDIFVQFGVIASE